MPPDESDTALVLDIIDACERIERFCKGYDRKSFSADEKTVSAVERQIVIIGEAATKLSSEFRDSTNHIPWRDIISMRHLLVHHYGKTLSDPLWSTATRDVPTLLEQLRPHAT
ncbi:MAG: DUF86 domain-containing protein [Phycisphaeraceae bacterium]|nr:MAG: DUF86 domain-containing protein [Phycisphaeraceae bacterium]